MIFRHAFEYSVYSRFDFVRMIWVLHNLTFSEIINRYGVPGLFWSRICKRKNFAQTLSVSTHCNDQPKVLRLKISNPHKTTKQTIPTFGAFKKQAPIRSSRCMLRVKILEHAFSIIILFNLKNSVDIEWFKDSCNSCHKLFRVSNYYAPLRIGKKQKTSLSGIYSERPIAIIVISKGMTFVPF